MNTDTYTVRTNEVSLTFHYDTLLDNYRFYEIVDRETKGTKKADYRLFYQSIKQILNPEARCVLPGYPRRYIVALKPSETIPDTVFSFRRIHKEELTSLPKGKMFSLLLSTMMKRGLYFEPGSLPYDIYYIHTVQKKKIITLKLDVVEQASHVYLNLSVVTFIETDPAKTKKSLFVYEQGTLVDYDAKKHKGKKVYIKGNFGNTKTTVDFMDIGGAKFTKTKTYFLNMVHQDIKTLLAPYLDMTFKAKDISVYASTDDAQKRRNAIKTRIRKYILQHFPVLPIIDLSCTETYVLELREQLQRITDGLVSFPISNNFPKNIQAAITVIESESFYQETGQEDPYLKSRSYTAVTQNITTSSEPSESASMVILKELAIKSELRGMPPFVIHPKNIEEIQYIAVIDDKEEIFYKAFCADGKMLSSPLTDKEQQYCESLLYDVPVGEKAEYIVISSQGTMLVTKTLLYPLPDFEKLNQKYFEDTKAVFIKKSEILSILDENRREELISQIEQIDTPEGISSDQIIKILNPDEKKRLKKTIGLSLKFSARDKASKKMYIGMLGTTFSYDNESGSILYRSGLSSGNIRATVKNNSPYRRIIPVHGDIDLDVILPLLDEYFVKYGEITVLPYPVKYAREGWQMAADSKAKKVK